MPKDFGFAEPRKGVCHDGVYECEHFDGNTSILLEPVPEVLSKLVLKDAVSISCDGDGRPP